MNRTGVARLGPAFAALLLAAPADAALQLVSQERSVSWEVSHTESEFASCIPFLTPGCTPDSVDVSSSDDAASAPDAGPWTGAVSTAPGTAASQTSEITGTLVSASGSHMGSSVYTNSGGFPVTFVSEDHTSATAFTATFQITTAEDFHLSGSVTTSGLLSSSSTAFVRLLGPGAAIVAEIVVDSDPGCVDPETCGTVGPEPIDVSGTLTPGSYTLEAGASGLAQGIHSTSGSFPSGYDGAFDLTFALATPSVPAFPVGAGAVLAAALGGLGGVALRRRARAVTRAGSAAAPSPRS